MEKPKDSKIIKIKIPDEDVQNWIKTLIEENFSQEEIDNILSNLNQKYKQIRLSKEQKIINQAFINIQNYIYKKYKIFFLLTKDEKEDFEKKCLNLIQKIKKGYKEDFNEEIQEDLLQKILNTMLEQNIDKKFNILKNSQQESE